MSDQPTWTVREEVTEVLKRRRTIEQQYKRIRSFYASQIQEKVTKFNVPEDLIVSAYYLAREIMAEVGTPHKYAADVATFQMEILTDDARVELIIDTLIEARKYYGGKKIEEIASYYQLIHEISMKIFKSYVVQKRMHILERVIICTITDSYLNPMFNFFQELIPKMDFRWLIAEIEAFLRKDFPKVYYTDAIREFPDSSFNEELFFEAGAWIIKRYIDWVAKLADEKDVVKLQDVGQKSYVYALSTFYNVEENSLITTPNPTNEKGLEIQEKLVSISEKLLLVNKDVVNKSPYKFKYGKFQNIIEEKSGSGKTIRHSFIINEEYENVGAWQRLLLTVEDVNSSLLSTYLRERCKNLKGAINLIKGKIESTPKLFDVSSIQYWDEAMINYTQEGQDYVVVEDQYADLQYVPITLTKFSKNSYEILNRRKRTHHVTELVGGQDFIDIEDFKVILETIDMITGLIFEEATLVNRDVDNFKITAFPKEVLFLDKEDPDNLILGLFSYNEEADVLVGFFSKDFKQSEPRTAIGKRTMSSKINQIQSGLHVKSFLETVDMKMTEETITSNNSRLFSVTDLNHSFIYHGQVSDSGIAYERSSDKIESVFEDAINQEKAELKKLQDNYFESIVVTDLIKLVTLKLNEFLLLGSQKNEHLTKSQFDKLYSSLFRQLKSFKQEYEKEIPSQILDIFNGLVEDLDKILGDIDTQTRLALEKAKDEVLTMSKEDIQNIFKI